MLIDGCCCSQVLLSGSHTRAPAPLCPTESRRPDLLERLLIALRQASTQRKGKAGQRLFSRAVRSQVDWVARLLIATRRHPTRCGLPLSCCPLKCNRGRVMQHEVSRKA